MIRPLRPADWPRVAAIFAAGIETGQATFETEPPAWEEWDATHIDSCRLVAELENEVVGWAALSPVSDRCVYGGVAEVSVYVDPACQGRGIGTRLVKALADASEGHGLWTLQGGVFPENRASRRVLERAGFRQVGRRERLGKLAGRWRDVLVYERRSDRVGVD